MGRGNPKSIKGGWWHMVCVSILAAVLAMVTPNTQAQEYALGADCLKAKFCLPDATEEVLKRFGNHAFGFENDAPDFNELARWDVEVRAKIIGRKSQDVYQEVLSIFKELSSLSGVPVTDTGRPNYVIVVDDDPLDYFLQATTERQQNLVFGSRDEIDSFRSSIESEEEPDCGGFVVIGGHSSDTRPLVENSDVSDSIGFTLILAEYADNKSKLMRCLYEEMYQGFGLFNDSTDAVCTMFDNRKIPDSPTTLDRLLLYLLYYQGLRSGMQKEEALKSLRTFLYSYEPLRELMISGPSC